MLMRLRNNHKTVSVFYFSFISPYATGLRIFVVYTFDKNRAVARNNTCTMPISIDTECAGRMFSFDTFRGSWHGHAYVL